MNQVFGEFTTVYKTGEKWYRKIIKKKKKFVADVWREKGKKEEIWLSPMTKAPYTHRKIQKATWQQKTASKTLITQRLRTDLGR